MSTWRTIRRRRGPSLPGGRREPQQCHYVLHWGPARADTRARAWAGPRKSLSHPQNGSAARGYRPSPRCADPRLIASRHYYPAGRARFTPARQPARLPPPHLTASVPLSPPDGADGDNQGEDENEEAKGEAGTETEGEPCTHPPSRAIAGVVTAVGQEAGSCRACRPWQRSWGRTGHPGLPDQGGPRHCWRPRPEGRTLRSHRRTLLPSSWFER
jgi:hypothetical protein